MTSGLLLTRKTKITMNNQELKEFLEWLTDETAYNIQKDEINEIVQDWNYFKANPSDENNKPFAIPDVSNSVCEFCGADHLLNLR